MTEEYLVREVADQGVSGRVLWSSPDAPSFDYGTVIIRGGMSHKLVLALGEMHRYSIVGQHCCHDLGDTRKHLPDVEHVRQRLEQIF